MCWKSVALARPCIRARILASTHRLIKPSGVWPSCGKLSTAGALQGWPWTLSAATTSASFSTCVSLGVAAFTAVAAGAVAGSGPAHCDEASEEMPIEMLRLRDAKTTLRTSLLGKRVVGSCKLKDGRTLAYSIEGDGVPVIALHGMGSSRFTWTGAAPLSKTCPGIRLIAVDRPGYGDSSPPPAGYSYATFVMDLTELADHLGLDRFCLAGHSSGGPYALAGAALLPHRVAACAAISSDPPYAHPEASLELRLSDSMSSACSSASKGLYGQDPTHFAAQMSASALAGGDPRKKYAWRQGPLGWVFDFTLERIPWAFTLEQIKLGPALCFWVGGEDFEPIKLGAPFMQNLVPGSQLRVVAGGNHGFKSDPVHLSAILNELRGHWEAFQIEALLYKEVSA